MTNVCSAVLVVGNVSRPEFRAALGADAVQQAGWQFAADVDAAAAAIESGAAVPDVIVVAQAYPGEIENAAVERLRRLCPLARLVGLLGTWCEGEARSGHPWPGVARVAWHQWPWRGPRQLAALAAGRPTPLVLPATATAEEAVLADTQSTLMRETARIAIASPNRAMAEMLAAACESWGVEAVNVGWVERCETHAASLPRGSRRPPPTMQAWCPVGARRPTLQLFDCDELNDAALGELAAFVQTAAMAHIAVLANFPRLDDVLRALAAGAAVVFSKPVDLNDLRAWLDTVLATA